MFFFLLVMLPDRVVAVLVAHELAHVLQYASGTIADDERTNEYDADEQCRWWGYDPDEFDGWKAAQTVPEGDELTE